MNLSNLDPSSELGSALSIAQVAADSRLFKLNVPQAAMQILAGRELGIGAVASIRGVHLVQGETVLDYTILAALVQRSGTYDVETTPIRNAAGEVVGFEWDRHHCSLDFYRINPDGSRRLIGQSVFDEEDATRAKLLQKDNWKKYPKAMFQARAMSQGVRAHCSAVTMGSVYVPGEIPTQDAAPIQLPPQWAESEALDAVSRPVEATQVAERPAEVGPLNGPPVIEAPRSAPTEELPRPASPELQALAIRVRFRIPSSPIVRQLFEAATSGDSESLQRAIEAAANRYPEIVDRAKREEPRHATECATCFGRLPCSASAGCGGRRSLSAKEQLRAQLDAEDAAARPAPDPDRILSEARASATALAMSLPAERRGAARAAIDCARSVEEVEKLRGRIQAGLSQVEDAKAAAAVGGGVDLGGLA